MSDNRGETNGPGFPRLVIETSGRIGSVAIDDGTTITAQTFSEPLAHGRELLTASRDVSKRLGLTPDDLQSVAVSVGPGSYTGVRIGVSAAKAIAWAGQLPVIAVSSLEGLVQNAVDAGAVTGEDVVDVVGDARRGSVYFARFRFAEGQVVRVESDQILPADSTPPQPESRTLLLAMAGKVLDAWSGYERVDARCETPSAEAIARCARRAKPGLSDQARHHAVWIDDPHTLVPTYLRPSEAEEKRLAKG